MTAPHKVAMGLAICTPIPYVDDGHGGTATALIHPLWARKRYGMSLPTNFNSVDLVADGMEVADARNSVVKRCLDMPNRPEFLFFLDYDVIPEFNTLTSLFFTARHWPDYDIFSGVYCCKMDPAEPLIYRGDYGSGPYWDWTVGDILTSDDHDITGCPMGVCLIRMSLFDRLPWDEENPWFKTTNEQKIKHGLVQTKRGTEDLWFCREARTKADAKILFDTSVLCGHIDPRSGVIYGLPWNCGPVKRAKWMPQQSRGDGKQEELAEDGTPKEYFEEKKALDIGAGSQRREWPGHVTYTTDIRPEVKADYTCHTLKLAIPDDHFDIVASSHHIEHLGRWDQESGWSEHVRVCKPGGRIEIVVPNVLWALEQFKDGKTSQYGTAYNVLYGAQEEHGYDRRWNTHYFGYTPEIARKMAEGAGLTDITVVDYTENPDCQFEIHIYATKPVEVEEDENPIVANNNGEEIAEAEETEEETELIAELVEE